MSSRALAGRQEPVFRFYKAAHEQPVPERRLHHARLEPPPVGGETADPAELDAARHGRPAATRGALAPHALEHAAIADEVDHAFEGDAPTAGRGSRRRRRRGRRSSRRRRRRLPLQQLGHTEPVAELGHAESLELLVQRRLVTARRSESLDVGAGRGEAL